LPRPIETLLSLPRVRLIDRVPILETEKCVRLFKDREAYRPKLVQQALQVARGSAKQFFADDESLSTLLEEIDSAQYIVTKRSKKTMEDMLSSICADGSIYKEFEDEIDPLCRSSPPLYQTSKLADGLADKAREESIDVARALLINLPTRSPDRRLTQTHAPDTPTGP